MRERHAHAEQKQSEDSMITQSLQLSKSIEKIGRKAKGKGKKTRLLNVITTCLPCAGFTSFATTTRHRMNCQGSSQPGS